MKTTRSASLAALMSLAFAASAAHASDAATAKLLDCMKLEAASPKQEACLRDAQALGSAPKPVAAATHAPAAAAVRKPLPAAAPLAKVQLATAPPEVRKAVAAQKLEDIDGMDCQQAAQKVSYRNSEAQQRKLMEQMEAIRGANEKLGKLKLVHRLLLGDVTDAAAKAAKDVVSLPKGALEPLTGEQRALIKNRGPNGEYLVTPTEAAKLLAMTKAAIDARAAAQHAEGQQLQAAIEQADAANATVTAYLKYISKTCESVVQKAS